VIPAGRIAIACAGLLLISGILFGTGRLTAQAAPPTGEFTGVASCAGSTCHGRAEGNGAVVRQDEILTWQEPSAPSGAHSRAYAALAGRRGQQIADSLGIGPATAAPECLGCHTTYAPASLRGPRFQLGDGVGCESCHGAASSWIASHYAVGGTHPANVAAGLTPLDQPQVRANVCLDCHYGSTGEGQFVTHQMMAAGHPRISFELDLFSSLQQHHQEDADYRQRKPASDSVRLWAVGQAEAVRRATELFANPRYGQMGIFPQYTFYDCHSCHRGIADGPERRLTFEANPGRPIPFGMAPFNDENIIMLSAVARVLTPERAAGFDRASRDFHAAMGQDRGAAEGAARQLANEAGALSSALAARGSGQGDARRVVAAIAERATSARFTDYAGSAQAVMAIDTMLNSLVREKVVTIGAAAGIRADINRAYAAVGSPESYDPAAFRAALGRAAGAIGAIG